MKVYQVTFNDGGWHSSLPSYNIIAENGEDAIKKAKEEYHGYNNWDAWATEFKIPGYIIEVYDEKSYNRDKKIEKVI